ncbi:MAG: TetR/AcrR family transcriptional regulator [Nocardioidaceae bacterium]
MARRPRGELRGQILDATITLLRERGEPALVSIESVVSAVGCTPPALYYYFPTKERLLWEACRLQYESFAADLEAATPHSDDVLADLAARGEAYIAWAREHPASYRQLFMTRLDVADPDAPDPREPGALPDFSSVPGLSALVADLERARAAGHPVGDPSLAAFALWGLVHGFASLSVTEPDIPFEFLVAGLHRASAGLLLRDE